MYFSTFSVYYNFCPLNYYPVQDFVAAFTLNLAFFKAVLSYKVGAVRTAPLETPKNLNTLKNVVFIFCSLT